MRRPLCIFCLAFSAVLVFITKWMPAPVPVYEGLDGQPLTVEGQVYRKEYKEWPGAGKIPVIYLKSVHILEEPEGVYSESKSSIKNPIEKMNIICYMEEEGYQEPVLGAAVRLEGKVRLFAEAGNPGEFDMSRYYRTMKVSFRLDKGRITAMGKSVWRLREGLYQWRQYFAGVLDTVFPAKEASIMKAVLLGEKNGLDERTKELYRQSAIIHILSISGLHISMIGMGLYHGLRRMGAGIRPAAAVSAAVILCYGLMTGMSVSSIRAIFMFVLHLLANAAGRTYDMLTALAAAAAFLLAGQPEYADHSGFLFSFGAVASIGILLPALQGERPRGGVRKRKGYGCEGRQGLWPESQIGYRIGLAMLPGVAVTLGTLPVHLLYNYQFPIYSVLLNLAVIPLMPAVMGAGLFCMLIGGIFPAAAGGAAAIDRAILWFYEQCCLLGEKIPGGVLTTGRPKDWQVVLYLLLLGGLVVCVHCFRKRITLFWKCQWIIAALFVLLLKTDQGFLITMLDVGQGDCIYVRSGEGKSYLIDGGSSTKKEVLEHQILPYIRYMGVDRLEAVFVTHPDLDHCSGILELLEEYPVQGLDIGSLVLPDVGPDSAGEAYWRIVELAAKKGVQVQYMSRGQRLSDGDMRLTCVHPYAAYETGEANEYSLVLLLTYQGFTGLFTGDVEGGGEEEMWRYMEGRYLEELDEREEGTGVDTRPGSKGVTLLKVAHHGSRNSTGEKLLDKLPPRLSLISCGKGNRYGHPHEELMERLENTGSLIYTTPERGAVTVRSDGKKVWVSGFR